MNFIKITDRNFKKLCVLVTTYLSHVWQALRESKLKIFQIPWLKYVVTRASKPDQNVKNSTKKFGKLIEKLVKLIFFIDFEINFPNFATQSVKNSTKKLGKLSEKLGKLIEKLGKFNLKSEKLEAKIEKIENS